MPFREYCWMPNSVAERIQKLLTYQIESRFCFTLWLEDSTNGAALTDLLEYEKYEFGKTFAFCFDSI